MNSLVKQIKQLLQENAASSLVQRCLDALSDKASLSLKSTSPLPIQHVSRTIAIRAKINAEGLDLVEGFDDILKALNTETDESVVSYFFEENKKVFMIFTNLSVSKLFGVLISNDSTLAITNDQK